MKVLVIDIGSSFLKAAVLDMDAALVLEERKTAAPEKIKYDDPLLFEIPAAFYLDFVRSLLDRYAARYEDLCGVMLSTQMHGFVYSVPGRSDVYVSWQDMRCLHRYRGGEGDYMARLRGLFPREDMADCGVYIKPALGMANLYTLLDEDPAIPRNGTLYTIGSYIIAGLTGRNVCHPTNAGPLGLLNVRERKWDRRVIERLGFGAMTFPELSDGDFACCGVYRTAGRGIGVYPDYGDQQVSVVGSLPRSGDGLINIATASQVGRITDRFVPGNYEVRPYFGGEYLNTISNMPAGRGLDVLVNFLRGAIARITGRQVGIPEVWNGIASGFVQDPRGLGVDMTFYATAEKPDGGCIRGIHQNNLDLDTLFSAAFQDMADTYRDNLLTLSGGKELGSVVCSGGVSWNRPELVRVIEKTLGCPCRLSALKDEAMSGLYRLALCCMGICSGLYEKPQLLLRMKAQ